MGLIMLVMVLVVDYLGKNFLPAFARRYRESPDSAGELASLVVTQVVLGALVFTGLLVFAAPAIFTLTLPGFSEEDVVIVAKTFAIMSPTLVFWVLESFHEYVWQHHEHYTRVVVAKAFVPLTLTVFILALHPVLGVTALPLGFLCGHFISAMILTVGVPYRYRPKLGVSDPEFRKILRNSSTLMATGVIAKSTSIITQYFASMLGEGAISAISIARRICTPISRRAQVGVRMMVFSRSARAKAAENLKRFARLHNLAVMGILMYVTPIGVWYALESDVIVRAVFQRGAFTENMVHLVSAALIGFSGTVLTAGVVQILSNGFYALDKIRVPVIVMPVSTMVFAILAWYLSGRFDVMGLTLAMSVTNALQCIVLMVFLRRYVPEFRVSSTVVSAFRYLLASIASVVIAQAARNYLDLEKIPGMLVSAGVTGVIYLGIVLALRDEMLGLVLEKMGLRRSAASAAE
jgi:putative peptidoglycan lipid II flippase